MGEYVRLVKPTAELRYEYLDFYQDWVDSGEDMVPWVISKDPSDFEAMVQSLFDNEKGENLPANRVPDSTYWLVTDQNKVVGAVNIRHRLSEKLLNCGGHIGYGIRPSERRRGYATQLLALALEKTKALGIENVLVVCDDCNEASARTIIRNGGLQDVSFTEEDGNVVKRFWIRHHL
ncbi:putative acetyltransferase [Paenibacillus cellulosilyticus]|uniref:Putative acetyltransferase n=1 Tax=Paenibacillus cellulosilyticus TaxID=375489 RepID=A0A2V2YN04_9BACL|nr:GNAT family N-acetyltransferase [Paenibacillus cellulosilyticus]PWV95218.1 putative acetyltransferase [Paenibacillus cellulosilyticus]QKS46033.1 GNAT family N-acetyltransferase [Paenibacillus cellulosilyticus]